MSVDDDLPEQLKYTREHEWVLVDGAEVVVGITAFAAGQLGDVVFVELPGVGTRIEAGKPFGVVESVKSVSDLFAPLSGTVASVNEGLPDAPELVNDAPYGAGWMIRVTPDDPQAVGGLLSAGEYQAFLAESGA